MRSLLLAIFAIVSSFALVSCSNAPSPTDPTTVSLASTTGGLSLSITFKSAPAAPGLAKAPSADFVTGEAILTKDTVTRTVALTIVGGRATATVPGLAAGTWSLTVNFYNAEGNLTFTGINTVTVRNGKVTPISVTVTPQGGSVSLDFLLPIDPVDGSAFLGTYNNPGHPNLTVYMVGDVLTFHNGGAACDATVLNDFEVELLAWGARAGLSPDLTTITFYDINSGAPLNSVTRL